MPEAVKQAILLQEEHGGKKKKTNNSQTSSFYKHVPCPKPGRQLQSISIMNFINIGHHSSGKDLPLSPELCTCPWREYSSALNFTQVNSASSSSASVHRIVTRTLVKGLDTHLACRTDAQSHGHCLISQVLMVAGNLVHHRYDKPQSQLLVGISTGHIRQWNTL